MKLEEKGKIQPPTQLPKYPELVSKAVQNLPEVISATHWDLYRSDQPDGADFHVGEEELGHIHINGEVYLAKDKRLRQLLVTQRLAQPFTYSGGVYDDWVEVSVKSEEEARHAIALFEINHMRLIGKSEDELKSKS